MRSGRRASAALLVSVLLHLLVLGWLMSRPLPAVPPAAPLNAPIEFEVVVVAQPSEVAPAPPPTPAPAPARPPARRPRAEPPAAPPPPAVAEATPEAPADRPGEPASKLQQGELPEGQTGADEGPLDGAAPSAGGGAPGGGGVATSPQGLFPVVPGLGGTEANPYASLSKGRTLRNGEGEAPDGEAVAAKNAEVARRRVNGFIQDDLGTARARAGVVDGYFVDVRKKLQKTAENPPKFTPGVNFVQDLVSAWTPGAEQYAKTGNPYGEGKQPLGSAVHDAVNPIAQGARERPAGVEAEVWARQQAANRLREFADGRFGKGIVALVEIRQDPDGSFVSAALVQSSGNHLFDQHVMRSAPVAILELPPAPEVIAGKTADGMRTLWSFEGRISYMHKRKASELKLEEQLGLVAMGALSALSGGWIPGGLGSFDEVTGEIEYVDLTRPRFTCSVKLMRVY